MTPIERVQNTGRTDQPCSTSAPLVALVGNPNTGKTSVFNMLTGSRHRVANYPGVTVEKVVGFVEGTARPIEVLDLPGTYSLAARSPDEMIVIDTLLGRQAGVGRIDGVVVVADASNLERNLFLTAQVLDTGVPVVVALNMIDIADRNKTRIDVDRLAKRLGVPVVPVSARSKRGATELVAAIEAVIGTKPPAPVCQWPEILTEQAASFARVVADSGGRNDTSASEIRRCLLDVDGYAESRLLARHDDRLADALAEHRRRIERTGLNLPSFEAELVYEWVGPVVADCVTGGRPGGERFSDRVDDVLTHRVLGSLIFVIAMGAIFVSVFAWAEPLMKGIDAMFAALAGTIRARMAGGVLASFLADGLVVGVGGVLAFLPQILILFALITVLEDCGYLARAAFLTDRVFRACGLGGRSFIPLLVSFACAIPGVMAARTIENRRDRIVTIIIAPLMPCSARIPIYAVMVAAFVPSRMVLGFLPLQGLVFASMYFFGIGLAACAALVFKKTVLSGEEAPFLLELPSYKIPSVKTVLLRVYDRGKTFLLTAGTIILAMSVVVWALSYFPRPANLAHDVRAKLVADGETNEHVIDGAIAGAYLRQSVLGRAGQAIEPVVRPMGWDWRIGMATLAAFPAREVVISTLGIVYNLGADQNEQSDVLIDKLRAATWPDGRKVYTLPVALSIMVFFALCCQCQATVAVIKRETNTWRWPLFTFAYMTTLAYVMAIVTYQIGSRLA